MVSKIQFSTYFDRESWHKDGGTLNDKPSLTDESFEPMANINDLIVQMRGVPRTPMGNPTYDMENYSTSDWTFEDWQNQKAVLERKFLHLTSEAKTFFKTPQEFFKYCSNPENYELVKGVGVVERKVLNNPTNIPEVSPEPVE